MHRILLISFAITVLMFWNCSSTTSQTTQVVTEKIILSDTSMAERLIDLGGGWYKATGRVEILKNMSVEEAEQKAIENACINALQYHSGVELRSSSVAISGELGQGQLIDAFTSVSKQTTRGIILEKIILSNDIRVHGNEMSKVITVKVKIGRQKGTADPYFTLDAHLNRQYFKHGDPLIVEVRATRDCYLNILNIAANDSVYVLIPNNYHRDNFVKAGEVFTFPDDNDRERGLILKVGLLPGNSADQELIKILATKQKLALMDFNDLSAWSSGASALTVLRQKILAIPASELAEIDLPYYITP